MLKPLGGSWKVFFCLPSWKLAWLWLRIYSSLLEFCLAVMRPGRQVQEWFHWPFLWVGGWAVHRDPLLYEGLIWVAASWYPFAWWIWLACLELNLGPNHGALSRPPWLFSNFAFSFGSDLLEWWDATAVTLLVFIQGKHLLVNPIIIQYVLDVGIIGLPTLRLT